MKLGTTLPLCSYLTLVLAALYGIYVALQPRVVTYSFDGNFAPQLLQQCRQLLTPQFLQQQGTTASLQAIKQTIIGLEQCSIRRTGFQKTHVTIKGLQPLVNINQNVVLTTAGTTMPATEVQEELLERLPVVRVEDPTLTTPETVAHLFACIKALPVELFEQSMLVWHDKTALYLLDRTGQRLPMVAHHATRFTPEVLQTIAQIQQQAVEESKKKGRSMRKKIIDVRVKGQIIIRHMQGGEYESTSGENYHHGH